MQEHGEHDGIWHDLMTGVHPKLREGRAVFKRLPGKMRCNPWAVPFDGFAAPFPRTFMRKKQARKNPYFGDFRENFAETHRGGAEVETMLFADVRGSTGLAESMTTREFRALMPRSTGRSTTSWHIPTRSWTSW